MNKLVGDEGEVGDCGGVDDVRNGDERGVDVLIGDLGGLGGNMYPFVSTPCSVESG